MAPTARQLIAGNGSDHFSGRRRYRRGGLTEGQGGDSGQVIRKHDKEAGWNRNQSVEQKLSSHRTHSGLAKEFHLRDILDCIQLKGILIETFQTLTLLFSQIKSNVLAEIGVIEFARMRSG